MDHIVICKHCGKLEYYGQMRWLKGQCSCRQCYKARCEDVHGMIYEWKDLDGARPTKEAYERQEALYHANMQDM